MLHFISELSEHIVRDVPRILCDEIDADTLRAHKLHDLLDLIDQAL